ncbi:MAG: AAA family ATPase [Chloroflexi bacterium]|nr:AAA family ATPase [Chloroflexota bacterium]
MTTTIAIAGKGGTGKTTLAALIIKMLSREGAVLAIDADPATNLNMALGTSLSDTIGAIREGMAAQVKKGQFQAGISKQDYLELQVSQALVEGERIDLLAMGRPEGPGCYCAANNMLRQIIDRMSRSYDYVVIDCEAGMEHISRQTTRDIDILLLVSDPSLRGIVTAGRMKALMGELRTSVGRICLAVNRVNGDLSPTLIQAIEKEGLDLIATLPVDPALEAIEVRGSPVVELPEDAPLYQAVRAIILKLGLPVAQTAAKE